jgi:hypothetical protein
MSVVVLKSVVVLTAVVVIKAVMVTVLFLYPVGQEVQVEFLVG